MIFYSEPTERNSQLGGRLSYNFLVRGGNKFALCALSFQQLCFRYHLVLLIYLRQVVFAFWPWQPPDFSQQYRVLRAQFFSI